MDDFDERLDELNSRIDEIMSSDRPLRVKLVRIRHVRKQIQDIAQEINALPEIKAYDSQQR